jgi:hypothetical protein
MQRPIVKVARMRIADVEMGDCVNRDPDATLGWFEVAHIRRLHDGTISVSNESQRSTLSGADVDIVGVQVRSLVELS